MYIYIYMHIYWGVYSAKNNICKEKTMKKTLTSIYLYLLHILIPPYTYIHILI